MYSSSHSSHLGQRRSTGSRQRLSDRTTRIDRLSTLPDAVILHILSFLETKHAAITSVLSKKWHLLWTLVPVLNFREHRVFSDACVDQLVNSIHHALILHQSPIVERFHLQLGYMKRLATDVNVWLGCVLRKNVLDLDLCFHKIQLLKDYDSEFDDDFDHDHDHESISYVLPLSLFTVSSLVTLTLTRCEIGNHGLICWKSLKVLWLSKMSLSNDVIRDVLSGSPSLESLEMHECYGFDVIDIKSTNVTKVVINGYGNDMVPLPSNDSVLEISAHSVRLLDITGHLKTYGFCVSTTPKLLVEAKLDFQLPGKTPGSYCVHQEYPKILKTVFQNIRHVQSLTVGMHFLKILDIVNRKTTPCSLASLVCLTIVTDLKAREIQGISKLLEATPELKTFVIKMDNVAYCEAGYLKSYMSSRMSMIESKLLNLTTVKLVDFMASEEEIELMLFMLKNAKVLEKMIISTAKDDYVSTEESLNAAQRLLSSRRCSPNAVVLLS